MPAPSDHDHGIPALARRLADYVVLGTSPEVPLIAADYWDLSVGHFQQVLAFVEACAGSARPTANAYRGLRARPADPAAHREFRAAAQALLGTRPDLRAQAADLVADADAVIWIDLWLGESYQADRGRTAEFGIDWLSELPRPERRAGPNPAVSVIVPVRDRDRAARLRNLIACLHALADQDFAPDQVMVTVVETDTEPRCQDLILPLADRYLWAHKDGLFNKSWAVNIGLRAAGPPGQAGTPRLTCVLDADVLVDRGFLARNAARFDDPDHHAHLPYRWFLSMDGPASNLAIGQRVGERTAAAAPDTLRGLLLREPPGGCLWARTEVLHGIGGFDERYEGWGGEDDDVTDRLRRVVPLARFDDQLLHLDHPRPQMIGPDRRLMNEHQAGNLPEGEGWNGTGGFGDPHRFADKRRREDRHRLTGPDRHADSRRIRSERS
jgi:hypothetical protein